MSSGTVVECVMSALGQKQTWPSGPMNAPFTSESDIRGYGSNVCFVPIADIREMTYGKQKDRLAAVSPKSDQFIRRPVAGVVIQ